MCYSLQASKNSLLINIISCFILYHGINDNLKFTRPHKILSFFFLFVGLMQLYDWIFWDNQDLSDINQQNINYTFTKIAMISNHLQPIVLALLILYFNKQLGYYSQIIIIIYTIVIIFYSLKAYNKINYTVVKKEKEDNKVHDILYWEWNYQDNGTIIYFLFLLCLCILFYENFNIPLNIILVFIGLYSFIYSFNKHNSVGRFWCERSAYIPLLLLILIKIYPEYI